MMEGQLFVIDSPPRRQERRFFSFNCKSWPYVEGHENRINTYCIEIAVICRRGTSTSTDWMSLTFYFRLPAWKRESSYLTTRVKHAFGTLRNVHVLISPSSLKKNLMHWNFDAGILLSTSSLQILRPIVVPPSCPNIKTVLSSQCSTCIDPSRQTWTRHPMHHENNDMLRCVDEKPQNQKKNIHDQLSHKKLKTNNRICIPSPPHQKRRRFEKAKRVVHNDSSYNFTNIIVRYGWSSSLPPRANAKSQIY